MSFQSEQTFSILSIPYFGSLIKRTRSYPISKWIVERYTIDDIRMPFQCKYFLTTRSLPHFASPVITACDEIVSVFVERTVGEWQNVAFERLV